MFGMFKSASTLVQIAMVGAMILTLVGGIAVVKHRYDNGIIAKDRAVMAASASKHERVIQQNSRDVDAEVLREPSPETELRKEWERPDAQ